MKKYTTNLINITVGYLTIIDQFDGESGNGIQCLCRCECGKEIVRSASKLIESKNKGRLSSCGCKHYVSHIEIDRDNSCSKQAYRKLKISHKNHGFDLNDFIEYNKYYKLIHEPCRYCKKTYSNTMKDNSPNSNFIFKFNGIDRFDSSKGYTNLNCVSCCKDCNLCKNSMSYYEFWTWTRNIYFYQYNKWHIPWIDQLVDIPNDFSRKNGRLKAYYNSWLNRSTDREIEFTLNLQDFINLVQQRCYYCGHHGTNILKTTKNQFICQANGIDRLDNNIGYKIENCVPCCKYCNWAKNDKTEEEFRCHINLMFKNFVLRKL